MRYFFSFTSILILIPVIGIAQKDGKEKIVYFTDSQTKKSNISLALNVNPYLTNRRIMSDSVGLGGLPIGSSNESRTSPVFAYSFGGDLIFRLASSLELWAGVQYGTLGFRDRNYEFNQQTYDLTSKLSFINVPIQFSFRGSITEVFDLEFIPLIQINFLRSYTGRISDKQSGSQIDQFDMTNEARKINYTVGISLSGNFRLAEEYSIFVRPFFHYMLNPMFENNANFPRERYFSTGLTIGLRYYFN
ncbi:outer membrane beta-barrel protein [Thermaurantimonas aggregans]|nr:outer membrane beta-barrel protein [Thermaurantimonas aggregans]MCX8148797.1 outer membrane beta-barrel protein [Thermaurantimonas aggregans]